MKKQLFEKLNSKQWLEEQYNYGQSLQSIANQLNIHRNTVRLRFNKFNIKRREKYEIMSKNPKSESQKQKMSETRKKFWNNKDKEYRNQHKLKISESKAIHRINQGYKRIYALNRSSIKKHRLKIENIIGRKLQSNEIVHHKDKNKLNNNIKNLQITTLSEHGKIHSIERKRNEKGQYI